MFNFAENKYHNMIINNKEKDIKDEIIEAIEKVSIILGKPLIYKTEFEIEDRGCPHTPPSKLPNGCAAVYSFICNGKFLKIGKANKKSHARFISHHYGFNAPSTLAKSVCEDTQMQMLGINADNVKEWIKENTRRIDVIVTCENSEWATCLIEAIMHYKYMPRYEGNNFNNHTII